MTEIQPYQFPVTGQRVRSLTVDGEPWFVAADVCAVLGLARQQDSTRHLDDDEKGGCLVDTPSGQQQMVTVNEPGLYSLILRSRKPEAKAFKRWITHEVLPAIRQTGSYSIQQISRRELAKYWYEAESRAELAEAKIVELAPKAAQADQHRAADGCLAVGDFANKVKAWAKQHHDVKILHQDVWDFLGDIGLIIRGNTVRRNQPTAFATERDFIRPKETEFETLTRGLQRNASPRLTPAGEGWAWDRAVHRIQQSGSLRRPIGGAA